MPILVFAILVSAILKELFLLALGPGTFELIASTLVSLSWDVAPSLLDIGTPPLAPPARELF